MPLYKISSILSGKYLDICSTNAKKLRNNQNVCLWADNANNKQTWEISDLTSGVYIKSTINNAFGLHMSSSGNPRNCDIYSTSGNADSTAVNIIATPPHGFCKIQLVKHPAYYLTAGGINDGSSVYWSTESGGYNQLWSFHKCSEPTSKSLYVQQNLNQRYSGNDSIIQSQGCCVCCACDVASFYKGSNYTLQEMKNKGVYSTYNASCVWGAVPSASFLDFPNHSQNEYFSKIRSEIAAGRPVLVHMISDKYQHWVVAYGYKNGGASNDNILVLDPYGDNTSTTIGRKITLTEAMSTQKASTINMLETTSAK